ncbi:BgTH12-06533 [Blumeria graminis f. sp. triticale]|uniref:Bgt-4251 n=3 Tax=Blumeria graminis TaxID=34373 RepID=A0A061HKA3_BLUGR|nr:hypothetical protein BGT96224_4251 [Blumeria graminis f. sp. tritici 96224]CAD6500828.1 BgTH12-06533 [Blumeria graminis f. sp. triticale]VCU41120.1 Bgt-4251 [Blumeria graminis f. sp. tritici]
METLSSSNANNASSLIMISAIAKQHYSNLSIIERIGSVLSLAGTIFIVVTFLCSTSFHKPINRLVFYASIGNMASNVATLISRSPVDHGHFDGALCQTQAFLIQMFMPADVLWALAMSLNVYFTFYWHYNASDLRRLEVYYILACYGLPFVPAVAFLFISTATKGRAYGDATLWCWIAPDWNVFRIVTFYGIVWLAILVSLSIYVRAGKDIWIKRQQLRNYNAPPPDPIMIMKDPFRSEPIGQVLVSHTIETHSEYFFPSNDLERCHQILPDQLHQSSPDYKIEISANPPKHFSRIRGLGSTHVTPIRRYATTEANKAVWSYTKVSALFFAAMMITWIPSSANRVYSLVYHGQVNYALHYVSAFVLPLQGLWNAIIYATTSLEACYHDWSQIRKGIPLNSGLHAIVSSPVNIFERTPKIPFSQETDSITEYPSPMVTSLCPNNHQQQPEAVD